MIRNPEGESRAGTSRRLFSANSASSSGDKYNSGEACLSIRLVDSLVDAFDALLGPLDKGIVIRHVDLFPHVTHHAQVGIRVHMELVAHLPVGVPTGKSPQYDCFFTG